MITASAQAQSGNFAVDLNAEANAQTAQFSDNPRIPSDDQPLIRINQAHHIDVCFGRQATNIMCDAAYAPQQTLDVGLESGADLGKTRFYSPAVPRSRREQRRPYFANHPGRVRVYADNSRDVCRFMSFAEHTKPDVNLWPMKRIVTGYH